MVEIGEASGTLEKVFSRLGDYLDQRRETKSTLLSISIYPTILFIVGFLTIAFILTFVFPRIIYVFENIGEGTLPLITKVFIGLSQFMVHYGWILLVLLLICCGVFINLYRIDKFKYAIDRKIYTMPILGNFIQKVTFVQFSQVLGMVLSEGVSLVDGIKMVTGVVQNSYVKTQMEEIQNKVTQGTSLSNALTRSELFSPIMVSIVTVGEETGDLESTLISVSESYEKEIQDNSKRFLSILEPVLILLLALGIGFIVLSILLPIFQIDFNIN